MSMTRGFVPDLVQRSAHDSGKLSIDQHRPGGRVAQNEADGAGIEAGIDRA